MENLNVKSLASVLVSIFCISLLGSGVYNSYYMNFNLSDNIFDEDKYTIRLSDHPRKRIKSYKSRRAKYRPGNSSLRGYKRTSQRKAVVQEVNKNVNKMAHIQGELDLRLIEVYNSRLFKKVLKSDEVEGSLVARDGLIESLDVVLPNRDEIVVQSSEMNGNVFNYYYESEMYSGLIYQSENQGYMVTLVNGPYQGTKLKFGTESAREVERTLSNDENLDEGYQSNENEQYWSETPSEEVQDLEREEFRPQEIEEEFDVDNNRNYDGVTDASEGGFNFSS